MPPSPLVLARALRFHWRADQPPVLTIPHFALAPRERLFLHGPSGSGKSTLLSLIAGVLTAQGGSLSVLGHALETLSGPARDRLRAEHMGFIFQQFNLIPYLSALDNITLSCRFAPDRAKRVTANGHTPGQAAIDLAARLGLGAEVLRQKAAHLSVGQQQRVAAARALLGAPPLVIADEPTSALDAAQQGRFIDLLLEQCAASGAALLMVSHDLRLASAFHRVLALPDINFVTTQNA